jgi:hypothetical protein
MEVARQPGGEDIHSTGEEGAEGVRRRTGRVMLTAAADIE